MRDLVYYIAVTLDGFIARTDGSFADFPWDEEFIEALRLRFPETLPAPMRPGADRSQNVRFDAVLMGRHTYEVGSKQGLTSPYPTLDQFVCSRTMSERPDPAVEVIGGGLAERVSALKAEPGKDIWICGGSEVASDLLGAGLVDRLIVKSVPLVLGTGIPLLRREVTDVALTLESRVGFDSGYSITEYRIERG